MTIFESPQEHAANPPATWTVRRVGRRWALRTAAGTTLDTFDRKHQAEEGRTTGRMARLYADESRWYAGEQVRGWKPYQPPAAAAVAPYVAALKAAELPGSWAWTVELRPKRRSLGAETAPGGRVTFLVPPTVTPDQVVRFVRSRMTTLARHIRDRTENAPAHPVKDLVDGQGFMLLGTNYRVRLVDDSDSARVCPCACGRPYTGHPGVPIIGEPGHTTWSGWRTWQLTIRYDAASAETIVGWYQEQGQAWLDEHAPAWVRRMRVRDGLRWRVTDLGTRRWAVYRPAEHLIEVHWPLFQLDRDAIEYVLVHELAHARQPAGTRDHGPEWQRIMDMALCGWRDRRTRMNEDGRHVWIGEIGDVQTPREPDAASPFVSGWATLAAGA